jgi:hypothetical protein
MSQRGPGTTPIGVVYNTSMTRPDAALALAALHVLASRRESRIGSVCVTGAGLDAAIFCDIVGRFYASGPRTPNSNQALPVGLAAVSPLPPDPPMVKAVVNRKQENGEPQFARNVRTVSDTALAEAVLRNGVSFNATTVVVLSAPATWLARSLDLAGSREVYQQRVKRLVIVDSGDVQQDPKALRQIVAEWPSPITFCGRDVGEALIFPGAGVDKAFAWAPAHPVADAYRAFTPMPHDAPAHDLAAVHYAVHPESGFFAVSDGGTLSVADDGSMTFGAGGGRVGRLSVDPGKQNAAREAIIEVACAKPLPPQGRRGGG